VFGFVGIILCTLLVGGAVLQDVDAGALLAIVIDHKIAGHLYGFDYSSDSDEPCLGDFRPNAITWGEQLQGLAKPASAASAYEPYFLASSQDRLSPPKET